MKKIEAIIRKTKFEDVKDALLEADIEWFSYYDVRGIGKARQELCTDRTGTHFRHSYRGRHPHPHRRTWRHRSL